MNTHTDKTSDSKNKSVANTVAQKKNNSNQANTLEDNRTQTIQKKLISEGTNSNVAQLGKKKRDLERAKNNNPNGLQHHNRPEYQEQNERQMELINQGMSRKDAKRQAKEETKKK
nr:hypothetical protein [uncultured Flavobacterium sp.]